jgi:uncharacterized protein
MRQLWPLLSLTFAALAATPAVAARVPPVPVISVDGAGEVQSAPDVAFVSAGVTTDGATAGEALAANTKAMTALISTLKTAGIESKDIQTSQFSVNPRYVYPDKDANGNTPPPRITGYEVQNVVNVEVRKLGELGGILDRIVSVGANTINTISFSVDDPGNLLVEARKAAFADARSKAETYAEAARGELGSIISIDETETAPEMPRPLMAKAMMAAAPAPVPVEAGQLSYDVNVTVRWAFKANP